jgi:7,8-dihydropterin-6-yl-methyl-4-(beta-D-ribofuranosyl)aminobenzene 5'-phosphate synthase
MLVKTLVEDTVISEDFISEHGLSLYVEANGKKLLFDMGKTDLFVKNAKRLGVDLSAVEYAVVSHGHYDHGGGLGAFLRINDKAKVYVRRQAFETHLALRRSGRKDNIGLDPEHLESGRLILTKAYERVASGMELFSNVIERELYSESNRILLTEREGETVEDDFLHEQNMILTESGKHVLLAGCAHCGIVNIVRRARELTGKPMNVVIGGFHLHNPTSKKSESVEHILQVGEALKKTGAVFFTGHCTGPGPYRILKEVLGERLQPLMSGCVVRL